MKAVVIEVNRIPEVRELEPKLDVLQGVVGGYIEAVHSQILERQEVIVYLNEEGKLRPEMGLNILATVFLQAWNAIPDSDRIMGNVVIFGVAINGNERNVPDWLLQVVRTLTPPDFGLDPSLDG